jgi:hypothetical protein
MQKIRNRLPKAPLRCWLLLISLLSATLFGGCSNWRCKEGEKGFHAAIDGELRYGPIDGFLQTPSGGKPGSTSKGRPTLSELGIDTAPSADTSLHAEWANNILYAGASLTPLSSGSKLDKELISEGATFPAGTTVHSDVQLDWYRVGYERHYLFGNDQGATVSVEPAIGLALFDFSYRLKAGGGAHLSADRGYTSAAPQLGLESAWSPGGRFSLAGDIFGSIPYPKDLLLFTVEMTARYRLWGRDDRGSLLFLGLGYDRIDSQDKQRVSNHVQVNMGPSLVAGVKLSF